MTLDHLTETPFSGLGLIPPLERALAEADYRFCTPIQAATLPLALAGTDVAGQAQTGTGKTAAFLLATFQHLLNHPPPPKYQPGQPRALILAPTRELAVQIHRDAEVLGRHTGLTLALVYGGTNMQRQREALQAGVDVVIGTPGRLIDIYQQKFLCLNSIQVLVLDEADRMFDLGFIKQLRYLLRRMPSQETRLNLLFSATFSLRVTELAYEHMNAPRLIKAGSDQVTAEKIHEAVYYPANREKIPLLIGLLHRDNPGRAIVFVNTKREAHELCGYLMGNGFPAAMLSGDVPQQSRQALLDQFARGELPVMVATDVAARGLHIPEVSHVFNYDLPQDAEEYVHRVGRTARVGAEGNAISFACERYAFSLPDIEAYVGRKLPSEAVTPDLLADVQPPVRQAQPRLKHRPRGKPGGHRGSVPSQPGNRRRSKGPRGPGGEKK